MKQLEKHFKVFFKLKKKYRIQRRKNHTKAGLNHDQHVYKQIKIILDYCIENKLNYKKLSPSNKSRFDLVEEWINWYIKVLFKVKDYSQLIEVLEYLQSISESFLPSFSHSFYRQMLAYAYLKSEQFIKGVHICCDILEKETNFDVASYLIEMYIRLNLINEAIETTNFYVFIAKKPTFYNMIIFRQAYFLYDYLDEKELKEIFSPFKDSNFSTLEKEDFFYEEDYDNDIEYGDD